jgi:hypothetical protein
MAFLSDGKGKKIDIPGKPWYHGSPTRLDSLRKGSSITRNRAIAEAFSHVPSVINIDDGGNIEHDGTQDGFLYLIDEDVTEDDRFVHEACDDDDPWEWVTKRELRIRLVAELPIPREDR